MSLAVVSESLLEANKLSLDDLASTLEQLAQRQIDYGDLYFQSSYHEAAPTCTTLTFAIFFHQNTN